MLSKLKAGKEKKVIAFGNSGKPLGERDDIDQLALIARQSNDPSLIELFETLPSLEDLQKAKVEADLKFKPAPVTNSSAAGPVSSQIVSQPGGNKNQNNS